MSPKSVGWVERFAKPTFMAMGFARAQPILRTHFTLPLINSALIWLCAALVIATAIDPAHADERVIRIPMPGTDRGLVTRLCMTDDVPAPLVIINHGSP